MAQNDRIVCSGCGKDRDAKRDYYSSHSPFHKNTGRLHVCKHCISDYISDDIDKLREALRMIDKPYITDLLKSSQEEAERTGKSLMGMYFKNLGMRQYRELTWDDSEFNGFQHSEKTVNEDIAIIDDNDIPSELIAMWGRGYKAWEFEYLSNFYDEYKNSYATDTPVQINLYKNIAKVHLQAEKELSEGKTKTFKDLMELSSKLHNDGNIKPIQSTGANDDKGLSAYGLWIKTIEQDEPCEHFENKPTYEDFDGFQKYINKWFVRPFKNIFNISKDFDVKDDD
jgi:hypothetical protein